MLKIFPQRNVGKSLKQNLYFVAFKRPLWTDELLYTLTSVPKAVD